MISRKHFSVLAIATASAACSAGHSSEKVAATGEALDFGTIIRLIGDPFDTSKHAPSWGGSRVDLMVADAWAACSYSSNTTWLDWPTGTADGYLAAVRGHMTDSNCANPVNTSITKLPPDQVLQRWYLQRNDANCSFDPQSSNATTGQYTTISVNLASTAVDDSLLSYTGFAGLNPDAIAGAGRAVRRATVNACIAKHLRQLAPDAANGETLLWSAEDQRQLLETIRERAQIAELQYAGLAQIFSTPQSASAPISQVSGPDGAHRYIPLLQAWASDSANAHALSSMAEDFAYVVDLHITATQEMAQLLARSASAHQPRGGSPTLPADEMWGPASWRQRLTALLYGGDPLAENSDHSAPWHHPMGLGAPGIANEEIVFPPSMNDWPTNTSAPYPTVDSNEPQVADLERLARSFDALYIKQGTASSGVTKLDPAGSASRLYRAVEAGLRTTNCTRVVNGSCTAFQASDIPAVDGSSAATSYQSFELWNRYRITPAHAATLAQRIAEYVGFAATNASSAPIDVPGALNVSGVDSVVPLSDSGATANWYHIAKDAQFRGRQHAQKTTPFTHLAAMHIPPFIFPEASAQYQGIQASSFEQESARRMGAASALVATRDALSLAADRIGNGAAADAGYFARRKNILSLMSGAIGNTSVAVTPLPNVQTMAQGVDVVHSATPKYHWTVRVRTPADDTWWSASSSGTYTIYAVPNTPWAATLALYPTSKSFVQGATIDSVLSAQNGAVAGVLSSVAAANSPSPASVWTFDVALPRTSLSDGGWTFIAKKNGTPAKYALLAASMSLDTVDYWAFNPNDGTYTLEELPSDGQYIAWGGSLNAYEATVTAHDLVSPARPAFDAFGLPMRWTPPTDPQLFGGTPGEDSITHYLGRASAAASDATAAIKDALNTALQAQEDSRALAAAAAKSAQLAQLEQQGLCGTSNPSCDTSMVDVSVNVQAAWDAYAMAHPGRRWYQAAVNDCTNAPPLSVRPSGSDIAQRLDCLALNLFGLIPTKMRVSKPVSDHQFDPSVPAFQDYMGGTLQKTFIAQWTALAKLRQTIPDVLSSVDAAMAQSTLFTQVVEQDSQRWDDMSAKRCSPTAMAVSLIEGVCGIKLDGDQSVADLQKWLATPFLAGGGMLASDRCKTLISQAAAGQMPDASDADLGWSDEQSTTTSSGTGFSAGAGFIISFGSSESSSTGTSTIPIAQRRRMCEDTENKLTNDEAQAVAAAMESYAALTGRTAGIIDGIAAVLMASADAATLRTQATLANARQDLEVQQLAATQLSTTPLYRQIHSYDMWRARALLDDARIAAVTARRALESRFVVDLSAMPSAEPFVAAPSTWADQVYSYDLDLAAAVGLSVGQSTPDGIYPNQVLDYTGNLGRFVNGFAVSRPSAVAAGDTDVLTLPGPLGITQSAPTISPNPADGRARAWSFACATASGTQWRTLPSDGNPMDACLPDAASATQARVTFSLDPWGRVNGDRAVDPFTKRYNARWAKFAVNVVGTGVLDCAKAADPAACYAQSYVRYEMTHLGPSSVTDWNQSWTVLGTPVGQIEGAKALAAEQWLDPLKNAWSQPFVSAIARTEFSEQPFGGWYELVFDLGPEVRLDRIERIQILTDASYWVKQQ